MHAGYVNDITLWLLLAGRKGLLSLAGESRMPSILSSVDSGLQQQVNLQKKTAQSLPIQFLHCTSMLVRNSCDKRENVILTSSHPHM